MTAVTRLLSCRGFVHLKRFKGSSSEQWLERQRTDPYVERAKQQNYRCRSAFKLLEIDDKAKFLKPGKIVVDIGAAPGSWSQVAVERTNSNKSDQNKPSGSVFSLDLKHIFPIEGATIFSNCDFEAPETVERLKEALGETKVDVVLSDMAPNASGVKSLDQDRLVGMCYRVLRFAAQVSKEGSCLLIKVWDGVGVPVLELDMGRFYESVKPFKPKSSRDDSSEKFLLAKGFKGLMR